MDDLDGYLVVLAEEREALALSLDAMQHDSPTQTNINDLPDDLSRLIMLCLSDVYGHGWGKGGMNALRLVNKRLMRVVESCATRLTYKSFNETVSLPLALRRCTSIQYITCISPNLRSLGGCPNGLKSLCIRNCLSLQSLEPLRRCIELESLEIYKAHEISDLSPLASCAKLMNLFIRSSRVSDLSPLSSMQKLEELQILNCWNIKSFEPLCGLKKNLKKLNCCGIDPRTSLLPLASCTGLKELRCDINVKDLEELKEKRPELLIRF